MYNIPCTVILLIGFPTDLGRSCMCDARVVRICYVVLVVTEVDGSEL